jgi:uracil-DNA glycosylase family 4
MTDRTELGRLEEQVVTCRRCPRLVEWRERAGSEKRAAFRAETYWARPVPGFGDPAAALLVVGLAPAAHGGNRTGRIFTGDRSGDWLFASMYRTGWANQPTSVARNDGLELTGAWVAAAVKCAPPQNRPTPGERDNCLPYLVGEMEILSAIRVIVALGSFAWDAVLRAHMLLTGTPVRPKPRFGHLAEGALGDRVMLGSYHPSQQNTFTGKLTEEMLDAVFERARLLAKS